MSYERPSYKNLAEDICDGLPAGVTNVFIVLNPGFSWLDFEDLCEAMQTIRPHLKLTPFI
jgi:hypothetical protein